MGFWGIANILLTTGILLILYFSFNSARQDGKIDTGEFIKLSGILILLAILCVVMFAGLFLVIRLLAWLLIYVLTVIKSDIFTWKVAHLATLVMVNAGAAYMLWEQFKEKKEEEEFKYSSEGGTSPINSELEETKEGDNSDSTPEPTIIEHAINEKNDSKCCSDESSTEDAEENENKDEADFKNEYTLSRELGLSHRIAKILHEAGIDTMDQLIENTEQELRDTKNIGEISFEEIKKMVEEKGFSLKT